MKKVFIVMAFVALNIGFGSICAAQQRITVGGYKPADVTNQDVVKAADFAIDAQLAKQPDVLIELLTIEKAERQLVQGTNFRLCLTVQIGDSGDETNEEQTVSVVIYRNLKNQFTLRSWQESDCAPIN
ncbi:MAG: hypothetical protein H7Z37_01660 [Pyrinomonadaceae bacterium]|nr:hypothetical protein [Pyrinomonadaceae bacterium]